MDKSFGMWNIRCLKKSGALIIATRDLARYKLDSVCAQECWRNKGDKVRPGDHTFFYGKGKENH